MNRPEHAPPVIHLLDVNVLVALAWPNHVHHTAATAWFTANHRHGWATTPVTESGFVRISSNRAAVGTPATPQGAIDLLRRLATVPGHQFWPDDVPFVLGDWHDATTVTWHRHVTDAHLLALAERHGGRLLTFDVGVAALAPNAPVTTLGTAAHESTRNPRSTS